MYFYWECVIEPLLVLRRPESIVEIGSENGKTTRLLLEFCSRCGAALHAVDPMPRFDVAAWQKEYGERFVFHETLSLDALPQIEEFDVVLIDGDHNWYTVYNELKLLEKRSADASRPFPLVLLHDVGWPFGRRDGYYDPDTIPPEYRHPHEGTNPAPGLPAAPGPLEEFRPLSYAKHEGGPRNGVLTAIEDFATEVRDLQLIVLPGFHGLGLLFPSQGLDEKLVGFLRTFDLPPVIRQYVEALESSRALLFFAWLAKVQGYDGPGGAAPGFLALASDLEQQAALREAGSRWPDARPGLMRCTGARTDSEGP